MKSVVLQILIEVAFNQVLPLVADEEQGFFPTSTAEELDGPNLLGERAYGLQSVSILYDGDNDVKGCMYAMWGSLSHLTCVNSRKFITKRIVIVTWQSIFVGDCVLASPLKA